MTQGDKEKKIQGNSILSAAKRAKENALDATKESINSRFAKKRTY